ncbi:MAG: amidohydrolase [Halioglobus sp.]
MTSYQSPCFPFPEKYKMNMFTEIWKRKSNRPLYAFFLTLSICIQCSLAFGEKSSGESRLSPDLQTKMEDIIKTDSHRIETIFKDIHQNPELGFIEVRTAGIIRDELLSLGFEVNSGIGKTGVLAILRNGEGPTVLYRADMDANAVEETTNLAYASTVRVTMADGKEVPVAHMCGHDAHVSWMLGMAHTMVELKSQWSGTLVLIGQPAEELIAGAAAMIEDGLYARYNMPKPDYMVALHSVPIALGTIVNAGGVRYAGTDQLDVTFFGIGGHGSMPQNTKDPVLMAATAVTQYQSIISRNIDPQDAAVLTVGSIQAGSDNNVIPDKALLKINLRWFSEPVRQQLLSGIKKINRSIAMAQGVSEERMPTILMKGYSTPLVNDSALMTRLTDSFSVVLSEYIIIENAPSAMASEDAHILLGAYTDVPLAYIMLGVASPKAFMDAGNKPPYFNHNGDYKVELEAIPFGTRVASTAVMELLAL